MQPTADELRAREDERGEKDEMKRSKRNAKKNLPMKVAKSPRAREGGASIVDRWAHENRNIGQGGKIATSR